jgi:hypothetical protein
MPMPGFIDENTTGSASPKASPSPAAAADTHAAVKPGVEVASTRAPD